MYDSDKYDGTPNVNAILNYRGDAKSMNIPTRDYDQTLQTIEEQQRGEHHSVKNQKKVLYHDTDFTVWRIHLPIVLCMKENGWQEI